MAGGRPGAGVSRLVSRGWPIRRNVAAWPVSDWFLPEGERVALDGGKPRAPARARRRLLRTHLEVVEAARAGDRIFFTGWRGDSDEWLTDAGPTSDSTWLVDPDRHRCDEPRAVGSGPDHGRQPGRCAPRRHGTGPLPPETDWSKVSGSRLIHVARSCTNASTPTARRSTQLPGTSCTAWRASSTPSSSYHILPRSSGGQPDASPRQVRKTLRALQQRREASRPFDVASLRTAVVLRTSGCPRNA